MEYSDIRLQSMKLSYKAKIEELNDLVGLKPVKKFIREIGNMVLLQVERERAGQKLTKQSLHMIFKGNPGTGKTTVARLVAEIMSTLRVLSNGHLIEVTREDLVGEYIGTTAKKVHSVIQKAIGGVLFIDEAYSLVRGGEYDYGREAIDTLVKHMEDNRDNLIVILAGYTDEMEEFLKSNSGLRSRFSNIIEFPDYTTQELIQIARKQLIEQKFILNPELTQTLQKTFERRQIKGRQDNGNGRLVRNVIEEAIRKQSQRLTKSGYLSQKDLKTLISEDFGIQNNVNWDFESELSKIIGNEKVKNHIRQLIARIKINKMRESMGIKSSESPSMHMIFKGNPGTGKTTFARVISRVLKEMGILKNGHLVETDRSGLVAGYVGQTAEKTKGKVLEALGGVLFIDEAYSLFNGYKEDFGKEAVDTLVKLMEDHREELVVIAAGYSNEMDKFLQINPGLVSRFSNIFEFEDYNLEEMVQIAKQMLSTQNYNLSEQAESTLRGVLNNGIHDNEQGNGRFVRNMIERAIGNQSFRLQSKTKITKEDLTTLLPQDFNF